MLRCVSSPTHLHPTVTCFNKKQRHTSFGARACWHRVVDRCRAGTDRRSSPGKGGHRAFERILSALSSFQALPCPANRAEPIWCTLNQVHPLGLYCGKYGLVLLNLICSSTFSRQDKKRTNIGTRKLVSGSFVWAWCQAGLGGQPVPGWLGGS